MRFFTWTALTVLTCAGCGGSNAPTGAGGASTATSGETTSGAGTGGSSASTSGGGAATATSGSTTSGGATTSSSVTSGAGGALSGSGDCSSDAQCPGSKCVEIIPGGFRVCADVLVPATTCREPGVDQCCGATKPCPGAEPCYAGPLVPSCGGVQMLPYNQCAMDECASDAACGAGSVCLAAAVLGRKERACFPAPCKHDDECADAAGGQCAPVADPCCGQATTLYCIYPGDCRSNADCGSGFCEIDPAQKRAVCTATPPLCPA